MRTASSRRDERGKAPSTRWRLGPKRPSRRSFAEPLSPLALELLERSKSEAMWMLVPEMFRAALVLPRF